jgi:hypothetical protein
MQSCSKACVLHSRRSRRSQHAALQPQQVPALVMRSFQYLQQPGVLHSLMAQAAARSAAIADGFVQGTRSVLIVASSSCSNMHALDMHVQLQRGCVLGSTFSVVQKLTGRWCAGSIHLRWLRSVVQTITGVPCSGSTFRRVKL